MFEWLWLRFYPCFMVSSCIVVLFCFCIVPNVICHSLFLFHHDQNWINNLNTGTLGANAEVVVAPPAPYLASTLGKLRKDVGIAAQDVRAGGNGAHTGEVSAEMLTDMGVKYSIIGHSERRAAGESSELVGEKVKYAVSKGLTSIACVGETKAERDANNTFKVIDEQLAVSSHQHR